MKRFVFLGLLAMCLTSCALNNVQHHKYYSNKATGVITDIYRNNVNGNTVVLDGKLNINVWDADMDSTMVIGSVKTFNVKWLTKNIK